MDGAIQPLPTRPWRIDHVVVTGSPGTGNISNFSSLQDISKWTIGNTPSAAANKLRWHKFKEGEKTLLICDRNILANVSWDHLNSGGYVKGKQIVIDGQPYLCRLLTGGDRQRNGSTGSGSSYEGGYLPNEWDEYITNENKIAVAPTPQASDLDNSLTLEDRTSTHNQAWNWWGCYSWCQETTAYNAAYRAGRGSNSARLWNYSSSAGVNPTFGWRPCLELLNSAPVISGSNSDLGGKSSTFSVNYTVTDADNDTVSVTEMVDNTTLKTHSPALGVSQTLSIPENIWAGLTLGNHSIYIKANDGKAAEVVRTYTFQKVDTLINFTSKAVDTDAAARHITLAGLFNGLYNANGTSTGAVLQVHATNNAHDAVPTWEEITANVQTSTAYTFKNATKTASKWGISIRIQMLKGTATGEISCNGFGFTFD